MKTEGKVFITCKEATYLHTQKQEGKLSYLQRFGLWLHLLYCNICRLFFKQIEAVENAGKSFGQSESRQLSSEAKNRMQQSLNSEMQQ